MSQILLTVFIVQISALVSGLTGNLTIRSFSRFWRGNLQAIKLGDIFSEFLSF